MKLYETVDGRIVASVSVLNSCDIYENKFLWYDHTDKSWCVSGQPIEREYDIDIKYLVVALMMPVGKTMLKGEVSKFLSDLGYNHTDFFDWWMGGNSYISRLDIIKYIYHKESNR